MDEAIEEAIEDCRRFGEIPSRIRIPTDWVVELLFRGRSLAHSGVGGEFLLWTSGGFVRVVPDPRLASVAIAVPVGA